LNFWARSEAQRLHSTKDETTCLLTFLPPACLNPCRLFAKYFATCLLKSFCRLLAKTFLPPACFHFFAGCLLKSFCRLLAFIFLPVAC